MKSIYIALGGSIIGLIVAAFLSRYIKKQKIENEKVVQITTAIREGALAFLNKE